MRHSLILPPATEPVSLQEAKDFLRVTHSREDGVINGQIKAARLLCEAASRRSFITQKHQAVFRLPHYDWGSDFSSGQRFDISSSGRPSDFALNTRLSDPDRINDGIILPNGPVASVDNIAVYLTEDSKSGVPVTAYVFDSSQQKIQWHPAKFLPLLEANDFVAVDYTAGLSNADFDARAGDIKQAILITVSAMYDQRGYSMQDVPPLAMRLLASHWKSITYRG